MTVSPVLRAWLKDAGERVVRAFLAGLIGSNVLVGTNVLNLSAWHTAAIAGCVAAVSAVLSILAGFRSGTLSPASLLKRSKRAPATHTFPEVRNAPSVIGHHSTRKTGRRMPDPAKVAKGILDLTASLRTGINIPVPASLDYLTKIDWSGTMYGNDVAGDCEAARLANWLILLTSFLGKTVERLTQDQVWAIYQTQNPKFDPNGTKDTNGPGSQYDAGMDTQTLLEYLSKHGFDAGGNLVPASSTVPALVVCFGTIDPTNTAAIDAAIAVFGGVWVDIIVLDANQTQFENNQPWTYVAGSPIDGGHAVLGGGYVPGDRVITWTKDIELAASFWTGSVQGQRLVQNVWVPIHPDHLGTEAFLAGVDEQQLASDFTSLTGKPFPAAVPPAPTPEPPAPTPAPVAASAADVAVAPTLKHLVSVKSTSHSAVAAINAWFEATGLS